MAVIENDIQYKWVRRRISKIRGRVDKKTSERNYCPSPVNSHFLLLSLPY